MTTTNPLLLSLTLLPDTTCGNVRQQMQLLEETLLGVVMAVMVRMLAMSVTRTVRRRATRQLVAVPRSDGSMRDVFVMLRTRQTRQLVLLVRRALAMGLTPELLVLRPRISALAFAAGTLTDHGEQRTRQMVLLGLSARSPLPSAFQKSTHSSFVCPPYRGRHSSS
jgi:hypothetical protein